MPDAHLIGLASWLQREALPTSLETDQLRGVDQALLRQSVFSATNDYADYLTALQKQVAEILSGKKDHATAILELDQLFEVMQYEAPAGKENTIQDLRSWARERLVVKTNVDSSRGYGHVVAGQDEDVMTALPGWELIRGKRSKEPRNWHERFSEAVKAARDTEAQSAFSRTGRMVALKTSKVWEQLGNRSRFLDALGNPWAPFAFSSGMVLDPIDFSDCESLGLIKKGQKQKPNIQEYQIGGTVREDMPDNIKSALKANLREQGFRFDGDTLTNAVLDELELVLTPTNVRLLDELERALAA